MAQIAPMPAEACGNCKAFLPKGDGNSGLCRAHPPQPLFGAHFDQPGLGVPVLEYFNPVVAASWWCSEWKLGTP